MFQVKNAESEVNLNVLYSIKDKERGLQKKNVGGVVDKEEFTGRSWREESRFFEAETGMFESDQS